VFVRPLDSRRIFEPEKGVKVKSKIEYLIYCALQKARDAGKLTFEYEAELDLTIEGRSVTVKPDFTIESGGTKFYWEHLGMLDRADYSRDWRRRLEGYRHEHLVDYLVTTDDLGGVRQERLGQVIRDLVSGNLGGEDGHGFSFHHYSL
jgi:hypothetical protein